MRSETGSASVMGAAVVCMLMAFGVLAGQYVMLLTLRARVASAADLAAAAGASQLAQADEEACRTAARISLANGAALDVCVVGADSVWVEVSRQVRLGAGPDRALRARAHAQLQGPS